MSDVTVPAALLEEIPNNVNRFWGSHGDGVMTSGIAKKTAEWRGHRGGEVCCVNQGPGRHHTCARPEGIKRQFPPQVEELLVIPIR